MKTHIVATFVGGLFKPDENIALPDQTRVNITIEPVAPHQAQIMTAAAEACRAIQTRLRERPVHGAGIRYTRDELHERR